MKFFALLAALAWPGFCVAQTGKKNPPVRVEKLCGKLTHTEMVPIKNAQNTFEDKTKNLSGVRLRLYRADGERPCCDALPLAAETPTSRWGAFHLKEKRLTPGLYWVVVQPDAREYRLLIRYEPKKDSAQMCHETSYSLNDAGDFWISETVTVY